MQQELAVYLSQFMFIWVLSQCWRFSASYFGRLSPIWTFTQVWNCGSQRQWLPVQKRLAGSREPCVLSPLLIYYSLSLPTSLSLPLPSSLSLTLFLFLSLYSPSVSRPTVDGPPMLASSYVHMFPKQRDLMGFDEVGNSSSSCFITNNKYIFIVSQLCYDIMIFPSSTYWLAPLRQHLQSWLLICRHSLNFKAVCGRVIRLTRRRCF